MEVKVLSSRLVKPAYKAGAPATEHIPLSVFDTVTYQIQMAIIYAFAPPAPSTAAIEKGLAAVLAQYRAFAGQLGESPDGAPAVVLNDRGARLVEASVDADLVDMAPAKPTPALLKLHPDLDAEHQEVVVLQLTRFRCGSLAVGFTSKHVVADGHATSNFLVAWGRATRGLPMGVPPVHHQKDLFKPRSSPARPEHDHRSREYHRPSPTAAAAGHHHGDDGAESNIVIHKAHFTKDFIAGLRARASEGRGRPFSRFETILAHLWRTMTRARDLSPGEATSIRISVDGRHRVGRPAEYFGNLVLWAFPRATAGELLSRPLKHAAQAIHDEVARVDGAYFQSFVDFASSGAAEKEGLAPSAVLKDVVCPDVEVDSWLTFPFYELDFGTGSPSYFMPSYFPTEGMLFLAPSYLGDGSVDAFVPVFRHNLQAFKECCYSME
ncbi:putrescine hydroxycinnamoyltransferase 3-like [Triticum dicoccoides]|uniref:putrescine hydroxycinnamoyltransferase 3-like n=1 Tax=Triticum dicoccoides TaxID=85692 RepID=UPI0001BA8F8F|nr:putrescine hydroxycinnamoyltransferase 3-like [Triticum dicoccoides]